MVSSSLLTDITDQLATISDTPFLDASVLVAHIIDKPRTWVISHPELILTPEQQEQLENALKQLELGIPLPYVLGYWEFFGLKFHVTPDVLIPRPETELLVEKAIAWLNRHPAQRSIADVGTGSGAIAVSIAINIPDGKILATDISPKALQVATQNAVKHGADGKIEFMECDLLPDRRRQTTEHSPIDLLCANLPYIPTNTLHSLPIYRREPTLALDGGVDGLTLFRKLMRVAPKWMASNSLILLEIEATLGVQALDLATNMFSSAEIHLHQDLTGRNRLLEIRL